jgi:hypothetical protein
MTSMLPPTGEHLTNGWEEDLDPADSLVRQAVLAHVSWCKAITLASRRHVVDEPGWCAGAGPSPSAMLNWVIVKRPTEHWRELVTAAAGAYEPGTEAFLISPFPTPDLTPLGLGLIGHPPLMARLPGTVTDPPATRLGVREATTPQDLAAAERVLVEGYPLPDLADLPPGDFYRPEFVGPATKVFVAEDDRSALATSAAHSAAGVTVVENVAALETARGQGAGAAITWAATRTWPDQPAVLIASDAGQPVYARLGFVRIERWTCWLLRVTGP